MTNHQAKTYQDIYQDNLHPYTDEEYMTQTVRAMYRSYSNNSLCAIKDTNSIYLAASKSFVKTVGMTQENIIGKTELDFSSQVKNHYKEFYAQDRLVETQRQKLKFLDIHRYENGIAAYITRKLPIINPATNNVLGTYLVFSALKPNITNKAIKDIHKFNDLSKVKSLNGLADINFSPREAEIIFCISMGITERKKIALFLSALHGKSIKHDATIKSTLKSIYNKIPNINTISDLSNCIEQHNLNCQIPQSMLKIGSFPPHNFQLQST